MKENLKSWAKGQEAELAEASLSKFDRVVLNCMLLIWKCYHVL